MKTLVESPCSKNDTSPIYSFCCLPNGQGKFLLVTVTGVKHTKGGTNLAVGITNNGELDLNVVFAVSHHVTEPFFVALDWIHRQSGNQTIHGFQLIILERQASTVVCQNNNYVNNTLSKLSKSAVPCGKTGISSVAYISVVHTGVKSAGWENKIAHYTYMTHT